MKYKLLSVLVLLLLGGAVVVSLISSKASVEQQYNSYIEQARINAEKDIPYNAYNYYKTAFTIHNNDESIYLEYLEQAKKLGDSYYSAAIEEYVLLFPQSSVAYELMCEMKYESEQYKDVIDYALESREKGIATDRIKELYNECAYMYKTIKSGCEEAQSFLGGYAKVKVEGLYGFINVSGSYSLAPIYEEASVFVNNKASVYDGERWAVINPTGHVVARPSADVDYMSSINGGKIVLAVDGKYAFSDESITVPNELTYDYISIFKSDIAAVCIDGKWGLMDAQGNVFSGFIFDDILLDEFGTCINNGIIFAKNEGKYYMYNTSGEKITQQSFDNAYHFAGDGPAAVCIDGKWGFINTNGEMVIEPQYDEAKSFCVGLAPVCVDGKWGYISSGNEIKIECEFSDCKPFSSLGIAAVKEQDTWSYIQLLPYEA